MADQIQASPLVKSYIHLHGERTCDELRFHYNVQSTIAAARANFRDNGKDFLSAVSLNELITLSGNTDSFAPGLVKDLGLQAGAGEGNLPPTDLLWNRLGCSYPTDAD
jgi:hypothetical protein